MWAADTCRSVVESVFVGPIDPRIDCICFLLFSGFISLKVRKQRFLRGRGADSDSGLFKVAVGLALVGLLRGVHLQPVHPHGTDQLF